MTVKLDDSDRKEVLRYLGYRGSEITEVVEEKLKAAFNICNKIINVRQVWKLYSIRESKEGITLEGADCVLYGESLKKLLKGLNKAFINLFLTLYQVAHVNILKHKCCSNWKN